MILSFATKINGKHSYFPEKILSNFSNENIHAYYFSTVGKPITEAFKDKGYNYSENFEFFTKPKIHTIREDQKNRWKPGNKIHFVINNRTKNYFQFAPVMLCQSVQKIKIKYNPGGGVNVFIDGKYFHYQTSWGLEYDKEEKEKMKQLAINDGFNSIDEFFEYFNKDFTGKIIHWTDKKY